MKIERNLTFTVAGIEFDNLKTAQFFQRAIKLHMVNPEDSEQQIANDLIVWWNTQIGFRDCSSLEGKNRIVYSVMNLQLPKPPRKKKEIQIMNEMHDMMEDNPPN